MLNNMRVISRNQTEQKPHQNILRPSAKQGVNQCNFIHSKIHFLSFQKPKQEWRPNITDAQEWVPAHMSFQRSLYKMDNDGDGQNSEGIKFQPNKTEIFLVILVKDSLSLLCLIVLSLLYILSLAFSFPTEQESLFFFKLL